MGANSFRLGERVWWAHTRGTRRYGTVAALEPRPGIKPDDDPDLIYLDADQLNHAPNNHGGSIPDRDGIYSRIPHDVYTADHDSLSSSGAHTLIAATPAEYMAETLEPPTKPVWDFGSCAHKMVLGEGGRFAVLDPAIHGRTKDGKPAQNPKATASWKAADKHARDHGKTPIARDVMDQAQRMAGAVYEHRLAGPLLANGAAELSGWWHDPDTGVRLRFRPDWLPEIGSGRPLIVDYKSAVSANPRRFSLAAFDYGYINSAAWYIDGLAATTGAIDAAFLWIVQCKNPPYVVSVCQAEPEDIELARRQNRRAIEVFARCRESGVWPAYDGLSTIALPGWARAQITDDLESET